MFSRIIGRAVVDEFTECFRRPHIRRLPGLRGDLYVFAVLHVQNTVAVVGNLNIPSLAAAGINDHIILAVIQIRGDHFVEVVGRCAVAALQIRADYVDHDRIILLHHLGRTG